MAINPNKLVKNLEVNTSVEGELRLYWESPRDLSEGEELVVVRRKDAFPVEIRNRNFEDRYTDVAQVEVLRASPFYCSHLIPNGFGVLLVAGDNSFSPAMSELERDNKYSGRLIRDSLSQVFRITSNNETEISYESISNNSSNQVEPVEGAFTILADFSKDRRAVQTLALLENSSTLTVVTNSFAAFDTITLNNTVNLAYGVDWIAGVTPEETASNIRQAMFNSGIKYTYTVYGSTILIERGTQTVLSVTSSNPNAEIFDYGAARGKLFVSENFNLNELRSLVIQDGDLNFSHIKNNSGHYIELQTNSLAPASDVNILDSHNNTFPSGFIDKYKSQSEAIRKRGSGLEGDVFYYYTAFTTPITSISVTYNEADLGGENPLAYTVDKVAPYYARIFYESLVYVNSDLGLYTYNLLTGDVTFTDGRDLSLSGIQIGDLLADNLGLRYTITNISNLASGSFRIATGLTIGLDPQIPLHGSVARSDTPVGFNNIQIGDTFKDIAGNSFQIVGTNTSPLTGLPIPPSHSFDIGQGLIDKNIMTNPFLVPFNYNPTDGSIQYGERSITQNAQLSPYNYVSLTGIVTYTTNIELSSVEVGHSFIDGADNYFEIVSINPTTLEVGLATGLTVDNTVNNRRSGSVVAEEGFLDVDGTSLIDLSPVVELDLFKTNSKADYIITNVDASNGMIYIESGLDAISLVVDSEFDGACYRRGSDVTWVGYENENSPILDNSNLGAVRRYNSVNMSQFAYFSNALSTQAFAISAKDNDVVRLLYKWWPGVFRDLDESGDLEDLMGTFGYKFNEIYSLISTFELQNANILQPLPLSTAYRQYGLAGEVSETLGIDTRRRIMNDLIPCWKLKGSREGLAKFIKVITTWDVTNGTGDVIKAIQDTTPELTGLRHYSPALGSLNTEIVDTTNVSSPPAGRFVRGIPGINLEGFFSIVEILIELPNVAMFVGKSTNLSYFSGATILQATIEDTSTDFGIDNSLKGCFLIPIEGSPNDYYEILSNTNDTLTIGVAIPQGIVGSRYVILSPLNLNRFVALQTTITEQLSYRAVPVFNFTVKTI
jgi:hypothetical protein